MSSHNILSMPLRAQAIREYNTQTPKPTVQTLADKYNVSFPQMRRIIYNRELILKSYEEEFDVRRQEKIEFLGKAIYEYVQRALQHCIHIDDLTVIQKAEEVKDCLNVMNFEITQSWLNGFKKTYNITSFNMKKLRERFPLFHNLKRTELTAFDLIASVGSVDGKPPPVNENVYRGNRISTKGKISKEKILKLKMNSQNRLLNENKNLKEIVCDTKTTKNDDSQVIMKAIDIDSSPKESRWLNSEVKLSIINIDDSSPEASSMDSDIYNVKSLDTSLSEIKSANEAIMHLRLIEEFAMLQDNYRAIGLLTQLENVFKQPLKKRKV